MSAARCFGGSASTARHAAKLLPVLRRRARARGQPVEVHVDGARRPPGAPSRRTERAVGGDPIEPGAQVRIGPQPVERTLRPEEGLLTGVLRVGFVAHESHEIGQDLGPVSLGELGEGDRPHARLF